MMNSAVCSVVSYVWNAAWELPLIAGSGWLASRAVRRWGPQSQHVVWTATWMLSILTPVLPVCRAIAYSLSLPGRTAEAARISMTMQGAGAGVALQAGTLLWPAWLIWLVFSLYACTLVYFAARLGWLFASARALVRAGIPMIWSAETNAIWQRVRRGFPADATVLSLSSVHGIVTIGAHRPAIILPAGFAERSTGDELLSALGHEMAHVARCDYAKNLLYEIGSVLTAFHPVTWMMKAQIVRTREMICDAIVVERLVDTKIYRQSLLRLAERIMAGRSTNLPAVGMFDGNLLKERIMMMKTKKAIPGRLTRSALAGCVALLLLVTAIVGTAFSKTVDAQSATHTPPWGTVHHIGKDVTAPHLVYAVDPDYPKAMKVSAKERVVCVVALVVDRKGMPQNVHIVRSAGKDFDASAVKAVNQYRFKPGLRMGKPVAVLVNVEVDFRKY